MLLEIKLLFAEVDLFVI